MAWTPPQRDPHALPAAAPPAPPAPRPPSVGYHAMRMARLRRSLLQALRRWGVWLAVLGVVIGSGGSSDPLAVLAGAPALAWWPLLQAAGQPLALAAWVPLYALLLGAPVWLSRPWWWPRRWAAAERALPWPRAQQARSDRLVSAWLVLPGGAVLALGLAAQLLRGAARQVPGLAGVVLAAAVALAGAWWLGCACMRLARWRAERQAHGAALPAGFAAPGVAGTGAPPPAPSAAPLRRRHWAWALLWRGLWRPGARGALRTLLVAGFSSPALAAGPWVAPQATGLGLALLAAGLGLLVGRLRQQLAREAERTATADRALPLSPGALARGRALLAATPALWAALCAAAVALGPVPLRLPVLAALLPVLLLIGLAEAHPPPDDATTHAGRHLLLALIGVALALEIPA